MPPQVRRWVDEICAWNFTRVIPCHFDGPVPTSPADFKRAFAFAYADEEDSSAAQASGGVAGWFAALFNRKPKKVSCRGARRGARCGVRAPHVTHWRTLRRPRRSCSPKQTCGR